MPKSAAYIAIDWGTTNRRIFRMTADGDVLDTVRDDRGILAVRRDEYGREIDSIRSRHGALPIIAAGMVGSTRGWIDIPYISAPADAAALAGALAGAPAERVSIVPGIAFQDAHRADVMRGEEVQVFGAIESGQAPADALFCQPGTHNKWIATHGARIVEFATVLTGELFALLKQHGILAGMLDGTVEDGRAFREGLARGAGATDLTVALFEVRAAVLLEKLAADDAAAFASGLLIGADIGSRGDLAGRCVHLLATGSLATLYASAIEWRGGTSVAIDSHAAFAAGIHKIWKLADD
ncbi:2-dehydro-3-deoxygalactonokinase [Stakelama marina]|uniref:2-dehydro-3-deoxygalactonokinase n=1 Tax=Stakelama marina TaxID=2826939 RepID=A0A8T4IEE6_9SPHN|nr:2-dehydro-3-deoxygalactonokinase [Stakelama marina]MBR0552821.1 2-dehydro-3-deoxygalactonokinase [Stakelama marina]